MAYNVCLLTCNDKLTIRVQLNINLSALKLSVVL